MTKGDVAIFFGRPVRGRRLAAELRARGFQVTFYNNLGDPGSYVQVRWNWLSALARLFRTRHQIYLTGLNFLPSFCLYLNWVVRGSPYIFNATGLMSAMVGERSRRWRFSRIAARWIYPFMWDRVLGGASWVVCNSEYLRERLAAEHPRHREKLVAVYNGVEFERYGSGRRVAVEGVEEGAQKLLAVMTWNYEGKTEGAKLLIDAMGRIVERCPRARLVIAAKTRRTHYRKQVEAYLAGKGWRDSVRIVYNRGDVPDLLAASDLFLYATPQNSNDSLPRVLLEAQAAGVAVVTTATAGCAEVVEDGVSGYAVGYSAEEMAKRAVELLEDGRKRGEMSRRGRELVRERFSWEQMGEAYAELLARIIAARRETSRFRILQWARGGNP